MPCNRTKRAQHVLEPRRGLVSQLPEKSLPGSILLEQRAKLIDPEIKALSISIALVRRDCFWALSYKEGRSPVHGRGHRCKEGLRHGIDRTLLRQA